MKRKLFPKKLITTISTITLSIALLFTSSSVLPTLGVTNTTPTINRISGNTRYDTSSAIAKQGWSQSDYAILAYGENFPDALAASPLAKKYNAPILLTESSSITPITKQTLIDLQVKNVFIIGGTAVVSGNVENQLKSMNIVVSRIYGQTQYDTAIKVAEQITTPTTLFVCTSSDFSDALSISPMASLKQAPIILVPNDSILPDSVKSYITANNSITKTYVIGNSDTINDNIANQFPNVERIGGNTKYDRNINIISKFNFSLNGDNAYFATGNIFADALTGTALASKTNSPIVLVDNILNPFTLTYLSNTLSDKSFNILGGTAVIPDSMFQNYTVTSLTPTSNTILSPSEISKIVSPSIVYIEVYDEYGTAYASGSGIILESNGKIITNYHVVKGGFNVKAQLSDGRIFQLDEIYYKDTVRDIFIFGVNATGLPVVNIGDSSLINTGDKIYTIGSPRGLENTISDGLISSKSRIIDGKTFIQISAPISHGSSGGALVNEYGKIIGITTSGIDDSQNLNFCIPINDVKQFLSTDNDIALPVVGTPITPVVVPTIPVVIPTPTYPTITPPIIQTPYIPTYPMPVTTSSSIGIMSDQQFESFLNNQYGAMTIDGKTVHFTWKVNDFRSGTVDVNIIGIIDSNDFGNWLDMLINYKQNDIIAFFNRLNSDVIKNYPSKKFFGNVLYQDTYSFYPSSFPANDISITSDFKWRVTHGIVSFYDFRGGSDPDPRVTID